MLTRIFIGLGLLIVLCLACTRKTSDTKPNSITSEQLVEQVAQEHFSDTYKLLYSKDSSNVCIYVARKVRANGIFTTNKFVLYNLAQKTVLFEDQKTRVSKMRWVDNSQLQVSSVAGVIKDNESGRTNHIYNMLTGEKQSKAGK